MRLSRSWTWLAAGGLLAGCGSSPVAQRVEVPIPVPCRVALPAPPVACVPRDAGRPEWLRCRLADCEARAGYQAEIEAALRACVE